MSKIITVDSKELRRVLDEYNIPYASGRKDQITVDLDLDRFKFIVKCELVKVILTPEAYTKWKNKELNKLIKSMY